MTRIKKTSHFGISCNSIEPLNVLKILRLEPTRTLNLRFPDTNVSGHRDNWVSKLHHKP